jgi:hypothetical protein
MERAHVHDKHKGPRSRGEQVAGSRWEVWWTEPGAGTGKTVTRRKRFAKKIHADEFAAALNTKFREGVRTPSSDGKKIFRDVAADWQASRLDVRRSHLDRAERELRLWVLPVFGYREVGSITKDEVQKFAASLRTGTAVGNYVTGRAQARQPFASATVRSIVGQVRGVLEYAAENNLMSSANPARKIKTGKVEKTKTNFLTFMQLLQRFNQRKKERNP